MSSEGSPARNVVITGVTAGIGSRPPAVSRARATGSVSLRGMKLLREHSSREEPGAMKSIAFGGGRRSGDSHGSADRIGRNR